MNTIEIDGKSYPVRYGLSGTRKALSLCGAKDLSEAEKITKLPLAKWPDFVLAGVENGCKITDQDPPSREKIENDLDRSLDNFYNSLIIFNDDNTPKQSKEDNSDTDAGDEGN